MQKGTQLGHFKVVEPLGAQMDIYGTLANGQRVLARTEARPIDAGQTIRFAIAIDKAHLFEPGTYGRNIRHAAALASVQ